MGWYLKLRLNMKDVRKSMGKTRSNSLLNKRNVTRELRLGFRNAPLQAVLKYFKDATDLDIEVESNVEIGRLIDLYAEAPVERADALQLLKDALNAKGYTSIHKGGMLAILTNEDVKKHCITLPTLPYATAE
jgi:type II secretory pathway component GspD/PulD (secretin)